LFSLEKKGRRAAGRPRTRGEGRTAFVFAEAAEGLGPGLGIRFVQLHFLSAAGLAAVLPFYRFAHRPVSFGLVHKRAVAVCSGCRSWRRRSARGPSLSSRRVLVKCASSTSQNPVWIACGLPTSG